MRLNPKKGEVPEDVDIEAWPSYIQNIIGKGNYDREVARLLEAENAENVR